MPIQKPKQITLSRIRSTFLPLRHGDQRINLQVFSLGYCRCDAQIDQPDDITTAASSVQADECLNTYRESTPNRQQVL